MRTVVVVALAALALATCQHERVVNPMHPPHTEPGEDPVVHDVSGGTAPGGVVHALDGHDVDLASLWDKQRVVIVFYMGHWCPHCQKQLGDIQARLGEFTKANANVVAVSTDKAEDASALRQHLNLTFDLYSDPDMTAIQKWGIADFGAGIAKPATFIVQPGGAIVYRRVGANETDRPSVDEILGELQ
jgi:peroxiredoxin